MSNANHVVREKLPHEVFQPFFSVFHASLSFENLDTECRQDRDDPLITVIGVRRPIDFGRTIAFDVMVIIPILQLNK